MSKRLPRSRNAIQTNLDRQLTDAQVEEGNKSDRRKEFISRRYKEAERIEKTGEGGPDVVFAWQRQDVVTTDPNWDRDPASVRNRAMLPVKQGVVMPDGEFAWDIGNPGDAAYEAARAKLFCIKCRCRQPDNDKQWESRMQRLEARIGPAPEPRNRDERCCFCGCILGFAGDAEAASMNHLGLTGEQNELMERMAGPQWWLGK